MWVYKIQFSSSAHNYHRSSPLAILPLDYNEWAEKLKRNSLWIAQCNDIHFFFRDLIIHWHLTTDMIHLPESQKK